MACAGVFERLEMRHRPREKPRLYLFGDLKLLSCSPLRFELLSDRAALRFDRIRDLVEAHQREQIAVQIPETREHSAPDRSGFLSWRGRIGGIRSMHRHPMLETSQPRCELEANSQLAPFPELGNDVLRYKGYVGWPSNQLVILGIRLRHHQRQIGRPIRRSDRDPAASRFDSRVKHQLEP